MRVPRTVQSMPDETLTPEQPETSTPSVVAAPVVSAPTSGEVELVLVGPFPTHSIDVSIEGVPPITTEGVAVPANLVDQIIDVAKSAGVELERR